MRGSQPGTAGWEPLYYILLATIANHCAIKKGSSSGIPRHCVAFRGWARVAERPVFIIPFLVECFRRCRKKAPIVVGSACLDSR
jgi:hypothetical protein